MNYILLEKIQPAQNMFRFYYMEVIPNLFGEWALRREWGRIGGRGGHVRHMKWHVTEAGALMALSSLKADKLKRGYHIYPGQLSLGF